MTEDTIKERLIAKIKLTTDSSILEELADIFDFRENEEVYNVSPAQLKAIQEGRQQIRNGQIISDEEANRKTDEWLNA